MASHSHEYNTPLSPLRRYARLEIRMLFPKAAVIDTAVWPRDVSCFALCAAALGFCLFVRGADTLGRIDIQLFRQLFSQAAE